MHGSGLFSLLLLLSSFCPVKPDCRPAEEGQETTLTCTVNPAALACPSSSTTILEWRVNKPATVIVCYSNRCSGGYSLHYGFSATINNSGSTLTITNVSRTDPFNMETRWACWPCGSTSREVNVCDKLVVFAIDISYSARLYSSVPPPSQLAIDISYSARLSFSVPPPSQLAIGISSSARLDSSVPPLSVLSIDLSYSARLYCSVPLPSQLAIDISCSARLYCSVPPSSQLAIDISYSARLDSSVPPPSKLAIDI
ncbi:hypothetical protein PoB_005383800 [Plakobranchus ocellatus]|uniref:Ig-like domain-containing protein n=1 Tax=Plakobranchus ocellatus TaxID=259542 RepID=A0AAV4C760_9GAST|nr:hypothetical protein PoB_005383800 [Plakobranchus ocellatus]